MRGEMRRAQPERALQKRVVEWLNLSVPPPPDGPFWTAINPNSGKRSLHAAVLSKAMGLKAGMPDLLFLWKGQLLWVELKAAKGSVSKAQKATHQALKDAGSIATVVCKSEQELSDVLDTWGVRGLRRILEAMRA